MIAGDDEQAAGQRHDAAEDDDRDRPDERDDRRDATAPSPGDGRSAAAPARQLRGAIAIRRRVGQPALARDRAGRHARGLGRRSRGRRSGVGHRGHRSGAGRAGPEPSAAPWRSPGRTLDSAIVSHPSLGLPPLDLTAGLPEPPPRASASSRPRLAARALRVAMDADPRHRDALRRGRPAPAPARRGAARRARRARRRVERARRRPRIRRVDRSALSPAQASRWTTSSRCARACARRCPSVLAPSEMVAADAALDAAIDGLPLAPPDRRRRPQEERAPPVPLQGRLSADDHQVGPAGSRS